MKILVTGGSGQLGQELTGTAPAGLDVIAPPRREMDITQPDSVLRQCERIGPDVVVNAAAYTAVDQAEKEKEQAWRVNAHGAGNVARAANGCGARVVQLSTDYVFDGTLRRPYREDDAVNPLNEYGRSKLEGERLARRLGGDTTLVVRTSWLYGPGGRNFVHTMLNLMRTRERLRVVDDQVGTPTWARGLAQALWRMIGLRATGTLHWSDSGQCSWYEFSAAIQDEALALGLLQRRVIIEPIPTAEYPTPARRPPYSVLDTAGSVKLLGLPAAHWRDNLREMLKLHREPETGAIPARKEQR